jgi:hypothetical protein
VSILEKVIAVVFLEKVDTTLKDDLSSGSNVFKRFSLLDLPVTSHPYVPGRLRELAPFQVLGSPTPTVTETLCQCCSGA